MQPLYTLATCLLCNIVAQSEAPRTALACQSMNMTQKEPIIDDPLTWLQVVVEVEVPVILVHMLALVLARVLVLVGGSLRLLFHRVPLALVLVLGGDWLRLLLAFGLLRLSTVAWSSSGLFFFHSSPE